MQWNSRESLVPPKFSPVWVNIWEQGVFLLGRGEGGGGGYGYLTKRGGGGEEGGGCGYLTKPGGGA